MENIHQVYIDTKQSLVDIFLRYMPVDLANIEAEMETRIIIKSILKFDFKDVFSDFQKKIDKVELEKIKSIVEHRKYGEPLAYILGEWEWAGLSLYIDKNVLIPRVETEDMVCEVVEDIKKQEKKGGNNIDIYDIGTGSGAIICAMASRYSEGMFYGVDISQMALDIANKNIKSLKLENKIKLIKSNLTKNISINPNNISIFLANLPYISMKEYNSSSFDKYVREYEPKLALVGGGDDGLDHYIDLVSDISKKSSKWVIYGEISLWQKTKILDLFFCFNLFFFRDISESVLFFRLSSDVDIFS